MDLKQLIDFIIDCESRIGNGVKLRVGTHDRSLEFRLYWPDGYIMNSRIDFADVAQAEVPQVFIDRFVEVAKERHPKLAPYIS
jgi:hypothetical protein